MDIVKLVLTNINKAKAILGNAIFKATVTRTVVGTYDINTSSVPTTPANFTCDALIDKFTDKDYVQWAIDKKDSKLIVFQSDAYVPQKLDVMTFGGKSYTIVDINPIYVGLTIVLYELQVRN